jgi:DNA-binding response OmpR family regulator
MSDVINILYVEDNDGDVELFKMSLERYNTAPELILDVATSVTQAKDIFSVDKHHAALIDWNLLDGEGVEVAEFIRSIDSTFPIVFLSGVLTDVQLEAAAPYNPRACLEKDYDEAFVIKVSSVIS